MDNDIKNIAKMLTKVIDDIDSSDCYRQGLLHRKECIPKMSKDLLFTCPNIPKVFEVVKRLLPENTSKLFINRLTDKLYDAYSLGYDCYEDKTIVH